MGGRGRVMLTVLGRGIRARALAWAERGRWRLLRGGGGGIVGNFVDHFTLWTRKWTRGEFFTAM